MDSPLISILLPTYNGARFLREAIDSVERQTYPHWELIIIDDASRDETPRIIAEYEQNNARIRSIRNTENQKLVTSLNRGIDEARGYYIARIDDDDIWSDPEKLAKQIARFSENPNLGVIGTFAHTIDENGKKIGAIIFESSEEGVRHGFGLRNQLIHTSILARTDVLREVGGYRGEWLYIEDFDLWLRILDQGYTIENIPEKCVSYRIRKGNTTARKYHSMQRMMFSRLLSEKAIYKNMREKILALIIRGILICIPQNIIQHLKR